MEDQELNEQQNKEAFLKGENLIMYHRMISNEGWTFKWGGLSGVCVAGVAELQRAGLESGDTEQIIQHLHRELLEAQEMANTGKQRCLELQGESRTENPASAKGGGESLQLKVQKNG